MPSAAPRATKGTPIQLWNNSASPPSPTDAQRQGATIDLGESPCRRMGHATDNPYANSLWYAVTGTNQRDAVSRYDALDPVTKTVTQGTTEWREMVDTERAFCEALRVLHTLHQGLLEPSTGLSILSHSETASLFPPELAELAQLSKALIKALESSSPLGAELCAIVKRMSPVYLVYLHNHPKQLQTLQQIMLCEESQRVCEWLEEARCTGQVQAGCSTLETLFTVPVQHSCRYPSLLQRLCDFAPDWLLLTEATCLRLFATDAESTFQLARQQLMVAPFKAPPQEFLIIVKRFSHSYQALKKLKTVMLTGTEAITTMMDNHVSFASRWKASADLVNNTNAHGSHHPSTTFCTFQPPLTFDRQPIEVTGTAFVDRNRYITSMYSAYLEKTKTQQVHSHLLAVQHTEKVVSGLTSALRYCDSARDKINERRKLHSVYVSYAHLMNKTSVSGEGLTLKPLTILGKNASKIQRHIFLETQLREELPVLLGYLERLGAVALHAYQHHLCAWLRQIIGIQAREEYQQWREALKHRSPQSLPGIRHGDIYDFFAHTQISTQRSMELCLQEVGGLYRYPLVVAALKAKAAQTSLVTAKAPSADESPAGAPSVNGTEGV